MKVNFEGTLVELIGKLDQVADCKKGLALKKFSITPEEDFHWKDFFVEDVHELIKIFPGISKCRYLSYIEKIIELRKVYHFLFDEWDVDFRDLDELRKAVRLLNSELKKIRKSYKQSRTEGGIDICKEDAELAVEEFNDSLPGIAEKLKIEANNKAISWFDFHLPLTVQEIGQEIEKLIAYTEFISRGLKMHTKRGRKPKPFSIFIFNIIDNFSHFVHKRSKQDPARLEIVKKRNKVRIQINWEAVIATLLWIHVLEGEGIPELDWFIGQHVNTEARPAIKELVSWVERLYSHFRASGKGKGKWGKDVRTKADYLDYHPAYMLCYLKKAQDFQKSRKT